MFLLLNLEVILQYTIYNTRMMSEQFIDFLFISRKMRVLSLFQIKLGIPSL